MEKKFSMGDKDPGTGRNFYLEEGNLQNSLQRNEVEFQTLVVSDRFIEPFYKFDSKRLHNNSGTKHAALNSERESVITEQQQQDPGISAQNYQQNANIKDIKKGSQRIVLKSFMFVRNPKLETRVNQELEDGSIYHGQINIETGEREGYGV